MIIWQAGMRVTAARLNTGPRGEVASANRTGSVALAATGETGILRLDTVLSPGRVYAIRAPRLRFDTSVATDRGKFHLRLSTTGAATLTSPIIGRSESGDADSVSLEVPRRPTTTETVSVLLSVIKTTGTGAWQAMGQDEGGIDLIITDDGEATTPSGINV